MDKEEIYRLVHSASAAKFFGVNQNSYLHKQVVEIVNTISTAFEKAKTEKPNDNEEKHIDS